jgi:hypothetical protein
MTSFREKRIQVIGLTDVKCTGFGVPGAETEGCTTVQVTFVDRLTLKVHQVTLEEVGGWTPEEFVAYLNRYLGPATNSPAITLDDINPDPRNCSFDSAWMPLPQSKQA